MLSLYITGVFLILVDNFGSFSKDALVIYVYVRVSPLIKIIPVMNLLIQSLINNNSCILLPNNNNSATYTSLINESKFTGTTYMLPFKFTGSTYLLPFNNKSTNGIICTSLLIPYSLLDKIIVDCLSIFKDIVNCFYIVFKVYAC